MHCPRCGDEYREGHTTCVDCGVPLVDDDAPVRRPARVGRFHPAVAEVVATMAVRRGIPVEIEPVDGRADVLVPRDQRDELRAELATSWPAVVGALEQEHALDVRLEGGAMPGWDDAPTGAWVDRAGRLRVSVDDEEERAADEARALGPTLVVVGILLLLLAWYTESGSFRLVTGIVGLTMALAGVFLPR